MFDFVLTLNCEKNKNSLWLPPHNWGHGSASELVRLFLNRSLGNMTGIFVNKWSVRSAWRASWVQKHWTSDHPSVCCLHLSIFSSLSYINQQYISHNRITLCSLACWILILSYFVMFAVYLCLSSLPPSSPISCFPPLPGWPLAGGPLLMSQVLLKGFFSLLNGSFALPMFELKVFSQ